MCAAVIEASTGEPVQAVKSFQEAAGALRSHDHSAVVIDEGLLDADPDQGSLLLQHMHAAFPIYVNCAINGTQRIVHRVQTALQRHARDEAALRKSALARLMSELREPLTGIILNCELVLGAPNLPADIKEKIRAVNSLARQLGAKLQPENPTLTNSH